MKNCLRDRRTTYATWELGSEHSVTKRAMPFRTCIAEICLFFPMPSSSLKRTENFFEFYIKPCRLDLSWGSLKRHQERHQLWQTWFMYFCTYRSKQHCSINYCISILWA